MRTTISLDDDVYEIASHYAASRGLTLSATINEVVRALVGSSTSSAPLLKTAPNGLRVIASTGQVITSQMVKEALEDDLA
jgi:hypothetical protein